MGLFDLFGSKEKRDESALKKQAQRLVQKYGPTENRLKVIEQLADQGTPEALGVLCLRFTVVSESTITDAEEKEEARRRLVGAGPTAIGPVKEFIEKQEEGVSWGLRVLSELSAPEEIHATVLALLHRLGREYARDPDKKLTLLAWLSEHHDVAHAPAAAGGAAAAGAGAAGAAAAGAGAAGAGAGGASPEGAATGGAAEREPSSTDAEDALLPLLEDFSDDVRISTVRVAARLAPTERTRTALIELLLRDSDNARVRGEVLAALAKLGADVKGYRPRVEPLLVEPYYLDREGTVKKRG
ncbi:MAG TPA: HEAT repeat domain-containing protein [Anaeromyxobacteraceae bacterium]|nr:HEAT repeat domain-containing protein [Anaeromyxobacteraceae bacterium]